MIKRSGTAIALAATTVLASGGLAMAQDGELPGTGATGEITFTVAEYSTNTLPFWEDVVQRCEAANPGLDINLESLAWQQAHDATAQRVAAGTFPDLLNTATIWLPEWIEGGALQPVSDELVPADIAADFVPALYEKGAVIDGVSWGLPMAAATRALFFNTDLFEAAGLDPSAPPTTWDEFRDAAVAIKEMTGEFGYGHDAKGVQAFRYFGFFLWNNGGQFFDEEGNAAFNSPEGVEALQFFVDLNATGAMPDPTGTAIDVDLQPLFQAGKLGMMIDGNYLTAILADTAPDISYGVAPTPVQSTDDAPVTWGVTDTLVIGKDADPAAVAAVITCIYQPEVRTQFDVNEGLVPVLLSQVDDPAFADPNTQAFIKTLETARFDPAHPKYTQMQELVKTAVQEAMLGTSPQEALDAAAAAFDALE